MTKYTKQDIGKTVAPYVPQPWDYEERVQLSEERLDVPNQCPICKGTGKIRHDWINRTAVVVNGHRMLPGVNVVEIDCDCMN